MRESRMLTVSSSSPRSVESQLEWMWRPSINGAMRSADSCEVVERDAEFRMLPARVVSVVVDEGTPGIHAEAY